MLQIRGDNRPSDYIYALMSNHAYKDNLKVDDVLPEYPKWKIIETKQGPSAYFGVLYCNLEDNHYVLVHRGTNNLAAWIEDFKGIYLGQISPQKQAAYDFVGKAVALAKTQSARLSFTGHSLGGFLAELSVFYCHRSFNFLTVNAVTFESPGSEEILTTMQSQITGEKLDLTQLDIIGYLSFPNLINTCNHHIGTLYQLNPDLGDYGWINGFFTYQAHSMDGIVDIFGENDRPTTAKFLVDWPTGNQLKVFYSNAIFSSGKYEQALINEKGDKLFKLEYEAHYGIENNLSKLNVLPIRNFGIDLQDFIMIFHQWREDFKSQKGEEALKEKLKEVKPDLLKNDLADFSLIQRNIALEKSSTVMVSLSAEGKDITEFRKKISNLLVKPEKMELLTKLIRIDAPSSTLEIISELVGEGSKIGTLINSRAIATKITIPQDASPQDVANVGRLMEQFQKGGGKIVARAFAPNLVVDHAEGIEARGLDIQVGGLPSCSTTTTHHAQQIIDHSCSGHDCQICQIQGHHNQVLYQYQEGPTAQQLVQETVQHFERIDWDKSVKQFKNFLEKTKNFFR